MNRRNKNKELAASHRIASIDALRGLMVLWLIGGRELLNELLALSPAPVPVTIRNLTQYTTGAGLQPADLVFPLLLFLSGCAIPLSLERLSLAGKSVAVRMLRRVTSLVLLQLILNGLLQFKWSSLNLAGPLTIYACGYLFTALLVLRLPRRFCIPAVAVLVGFWVLILGQVGSRGILQANLQTAPLRINWIQSELLDFIFPTAANGRPLRFGILFAIPATCMMLSGAITARWLSDNRSGWSRLSGLIVAAIVCLSAGISWAERGDLVPDIWSGPFLLTSIGVCVASLLLAHLLIDLPGQGAGALFLMVMGRNTIILAITPALMSFSEISGFLFGGIARLSGELVEVTLILGSITIQWLILLAAFRSRLRFHA